eukprot:scaffold34612_cov165-Amphora_coffeaeformis.AAC.21
MKYLGFYSMLKTTTDSDCDHYSYHITIPAMRDFYLQQQLRDIQKGESVRRSLCGTVLRDRLIFEEKFEIRCTTRNYTIHNRSGGLLARAAADIKKLNVYSNSRA